MSHQSQGVADRPAHGGADGLARTGTTEPGVPFARLDLRALNPGRSSYPYEALRTREREGPHRGVDPHAYCIADRISSRVSGGSNRADGPAQEMRRAGASGIPLGPGKHDS